MGWHVPCAAYSTYRSVCSSIVVRTQKNEACFCNRHMKSTVAEHHLQSNGLRNQNFKEKKEEEKREERSNPQRQELIQPH